MIEELHFLNIRWLWPTVCISIILFGLFIWKEWSKEDKPRFYINIIVGGLAILSLVLLVLKPAVLQADHTTKMVLLTPNYKVTQLDSLKQLYDRIVVQEYVDDQSILTADEQPEILFILGEGVRSFDLWQLDNIQTVFLAGDKPNGITRIQYPKHHVIGDQFYIRGQYQNASEGHRLVLLDPGGKALDSVVLQTTDLQNFELKTTLKLKGKFLYELQERDALGQHIHKDPIPLVIEDRNLLKIAIINEFPTFETKYLKNYLAEKGHELLIRSQLTTARFKYEYFNTKQQSRFRFTKETLEDFDLLIIDIHSLRQLSRNRRNILENAIRENGLGVIIQSDIDVYTQRIPIASFNFSRRKQTTIKLEKWPKTGIGVYPFIFKESFSAIPIYSVDDQVLAAYERKGNGSIGVSVFQNTFELVLDGRPEIYQSIWTQLLERVSRKKQLGLIWQTSEVIAYPDEPFKFQLRTQNTNPVVHTEMGSPIPLQEDVAIDNFWKGITYSRDLGWKTLQLEQDTTSVLSYYVTDHTHWISVESQKTTKMNRRYFHDQQIKENQINKIPKPINLLWFFLFFLGSMGWLWLEPKL